MAVTSLGCIDDPQEPWIYSWLIKGKLLRQMYDDMLALEDQVIKAAAPDAGGVRYTLVRPTKLVDGPVRGGGALMVGEGLLPAPKKGAKKAKFEVDRADVAATVVAALREPDAHAGKALHVSC